VESEARNIRDDQLLLGFMDPAVAGRCHRRSKGITRAVTERTLARIGGGTELTHTSGYTWVKSKKCKSGSNLLSAFLTPVASSSRCTD